MATANFFAPGFDEQIESQNIDRARRYAEMLRQSSENQPQGQMVSGHYVAPSWTQHLAGVLKAYAGGKQMRDADERQKALAQAVRGRQAEEVGQFTGLMNGRPADQLPADQAGPVRPAAAGDMGAAYQYAAQARTPALQQIGLQGSMQMAQERAKQEAAAAQQARILQLVHGSPTPQAAIAAGAPPDLVKQYYEARNLGRDKVTFQDVGGEKIPVTEYGDRPAGIAPLQKTGNPFSDLVVRDQGGNIVPNAPLVQTKEGIARAGASKTNVAVNLPDKKFYEGLGTAVSGQIEKGFEQAQSAVQTLGNANQIAASLDKAIAGPLANQRISLAQIGVALGVSGKDDAEVLRNTRNVIQGLARQELAAAGQIKGQGQITENERAILKKAESGEISQLTKPEIQELVSAVRKTARSRISAHQKNLERLGDDPQTATIRQYLNVDVPDDVQFGGAQASPSSPQGITIRRLP